MRPNLQRRQQIIDLRNQGMTRQQIADQLGITKSLVGTYLHQLIREGIVEPISKQEANRRRSVDHKVDTQVAKQMRVDGRSYREIAEHFGVSASKIYKLIGRSDRITPIQRQLISLRSQGLTYKEIAIHVGKPAGTIGVMISRLVRKGLIPRGR